MGKEGQTGKEEAQGFSGKKGKASGWLRKKGEGELAVRPTDGDLHCLVSVPRTK